MMSFNICPTLIWCRVVTFSRCPPLLFGLALSSLAICQVSRFELPDVNVRFVKRSTWTLPWQSVQSIYCAMAVLGVGKGAPLQKPVTCPLPQIMRRERSQCALVLAHFLKHKFGDYWVTPPYIRQCPPHIASARITTDTAPDVFCTILKTSCRYVVLGFRWQCFWRILFP